MMRDNELDDTRPRTAQEWGREGMRRRWGDDHGPTKGVRAFVATVDRFRTAVPDERDRAAAVTAALEAWLDARARASCAATPDCGIIRNCRAPCGRVN